MPALDSGQQLGSGELTTTSDTFVDALCTSPALADGELYLVVGMGNHRNNGDDDYGSLLEARFGTTRLGLCGHRSVFGDSNTGDSAAGAAAMFVGLVSGNGSSTLNMRARRVNGDVADEVIVGEQLWVWWSLTQFVSGLHYGYAGVLDELVSAQPSSASFIEGAPGGQLTLFPVTTGEWVIIARAELTTEPGSVGEEPQARLRLIEDPDGAAIESTIGMEGIQRASIEDPGAEEFAISIKDMDVRSLNGGTTYRIQWEFANSAGQGCGFRREQIFAIRRDAFRNSAAIVDAGGIQIAGGVEAEAANGLSFDFSGDGGPVVVMGCGSYMNRGAWGDLWLRRDGAPDQDFPGGAGGGRFTAMAQVGVDYLTIPQATWLATTTGAETFRLAASADAAPGLEYGRNVLDTANTRAVLFALEMWAAPIHPLAGTVQVAGTTTALAGVVSTLFGTVQVAGTTTVAAAVEALLEGDAQVSATSSVIAGVEATLGGDVSVSGSTSAIASVESPTQALAGEVVVEASASASATVAPDVDVLVGGAGQPLELQVLGGGTSIEPAPTRPIRFNVLAIDGTPVPAVAIDSVMVQVRRKSYDPSTAVQIAAVADPRLVDGVTYGWRVDLRSVLAIGVWVLEVDVELDGEVYTWPSPTPHEITVEPNVA